ncbi:MAG: PhzF family phenazine biosynthesis protein, partial [Anaerolineales bacterium]
MVPGKLHRYSAFTLNPQGGNPAGVWVGELLPDTDSMQRIAAEVGYSETAFIAPLSGYQRVVRYYSPLAEVSFCGHATIAAGIVLAESEGEGIYRLSTAVGEVPVAVRTHHGQLMASLTSVEPRYTTVPESLLSQALAVLGWERADLDLSIPPAKAYAGAWHLVLNAARHERLDRVLRCGSRANGAQLLSRYRTWTCSMWPLKSKGA